MRKKRDKVLCKNCGSEVPITFKGVQTEFCNRRCRDSYRKSSGYWVKLNLIKNNSLSKRCQLCNRLIVKVGESKKIHKFCSARCRNLSTAQRQRNTKYMYVKIPIKDLKKFYV